MFVKIILPLLLCASALFSKEKILVYDGPGAASECVDQTLATMELLLAPHYAVERIHSDQLLNDDWETEATLLIMPGGADIPYTHSLNGPGNAKIRRYVEEGGAYLGICAGSYYAGDYVDFAKETELEVQDARELAFFPGSVCGPCLAPYDYRSNSGARAAAITWQGENGFEKGTSFCLFYNGGGYFVDAAEKTGVTILATYENSEAWPAIIECQVGEGLALLSGVHLEYNPLFLDESDKDLKPLISHLEVGNAKRLELLTYLLHRLNLSQ